MDNQAIPVRSVFFLMSNRFRRIGAGESIAPATGLLVSFPLMMLEVLDDTTLIDNSPEYKSSKVFGLSKVGN